MQRSLPSTLPGTEPLHRAVAVATPAVERDRDKGWLDRLGAVLGFACALHCITVPLLVGVLPAVGLGFIADHSFDLTIVLIATAFAVLAARSGWRAHGDRRIVAMFVAAVALLVLGLGVGEESLAGRVPSITGGILLAIAHLANLRATGRRTDAHSH